MPTHGRGEGMTAGATFAKRWEALRRAVRVSVPLVACDKGRSPKASQRPHVPRRGMYKRAFRTNVQNEGLLRAQLPPFLLFNKTFLKKVNKTPNIFDFYFLYINRNNIKKNRGV